MFSLSVRVDFRRNTEHVMSEYVSEVSERLRQEKIDSQLSERRKQRLDDVLSVKSSDFFRALTRTAKADAERLSRLDPRFSEVAFSNIETGHSFKVQNTLYPAMWREVRQDCCGIRITTTTLRDAASTPVSEPSERVDFKLGVDEELYMTHDGRRIEDGLTGVLRTILDPILRQ